MSGRIVRKLALLAALAASGLAAACGGGGGGGDAGGITGTSTGGSVASVSLNPTSVSLDVGGSATLQAQALDGSGRALTDRSIVWTSSDTTIARIDASGRVSGVAPGSAEVAANVEGKFTKASVTVAQRAVASIALTPTAPRLVVGARAQFVARTLYTDGTELAGRRVTWTSSDPAIATVDSTGVIEGRAAGVATITATSEGRTAAVGVTVDAVPVASLTVTPAVDTIVVGQTTQLTAVARDAAGNVLGDRTVAWSGSAAGVASVSSTGLVLGVAPGETDVSATAGGTTDIAHVVVLPRPVGAVIVSPSTSSLTVGDSVRLTTQVTDATGAVLAGRTVTYASGNTAIATVDDAGTVTALGVGSVTITATSGGRTGTATIAVTPAGIASLEIQPSGAALTVGDVLQLRAVARDAAGTVLAGRAVTWTTGAPNVVSVAADGRLTATGPGTALVLATSGRAVASITVTVRPVPAAAVRVAPATSTLIIGDAVDLTATVVDAAGNVLAGYAVSFASSDDAVAVVSSAGRVRAIGVGTARVTATSGAAQGVATIVVVPEPVARVSIGGAPASLTVGQTAQLSALLFDRNNLALTNRAIAWTSTNGAVATVSSTGVVTPVAAGTTTITASSGGQSASVSLTVTAPTTPPPPPPPTVATVAVTLGASSLVAGQTTNATAVVRDAQGNALTGQSVAWTSSDGAVATVSASGVVTAVAAGSATITATSSGKSGSATLAVTAPTTPTPPAVASVSVALASPTVTVGQGTTATATLRDAQGNVLTGRPIVWTTSNSNVATVSQSGAVTTVGVGTAAIIATSGAAGSSATITVTAATPPPPAPVATVSVTLGTAALQVGQTTTATATLRDAQANVLTGRPVAWTTSDAAVATVSASGTVTAVGAGTATITGASGGQSGGASLTVTVAPPTPVASVSVTLGTSALTVGQGTTATATVRDAQGNVLTGRSVTWTTSDAAVATVSASGAVTAVGAGSATITATSGGRSGGAGVTVTVPPPAPVATVSVTLASPTVTAGQGTTATATLRDAQGNVLTGRPVVWTTSNSNVATVSQSGAVTTVGAGTAAIIATSGTAGGSATITVTAAPPVVATVAVSLGTSSLTVGGTTTATATVRDASGATISGQTVTWTSSDPNVASVSATGAVTARAAGSATITATAGGQSGSASLTVTVPPPVVTTVSVTLGASSVTVGQTTNATAVVRDAQGQPMTGQTVTWTSSNGAVASVSPSGVVTALGAGSTSITATAAGKSGSATLAVTVPAPAPVAQVSVAVGDASLTVGETTTATATLRDAQGNVLSGRTVTWSTSDASVATVSSSGVVTAVGAGSAAITATSGGRSGSVGVGVVAPAPVIARVEITPGSATLDTKNGNKATSTFLAVAYDAQGRLVPNASFSWSIGDASVAQLTVSPFVTSIAQVTGVKKGSTTLTARAGGVSGSAQIDVK